MTISMMMMIVLGMMVNDDAKDGVQRDHDERGSNAVELF